MGQKSQLWWDLPPMESYLLYKEMYDIPDKRFKETLEELVELLDLKEVLHVQVRKLSLGQRMKCELVAQLLHSPKILFLDEPTIGLDIVMQQKIRSFVREYNKKFNATILLTSHYMDDVKELCKRVIIIHHGNVLFDGDLAVLSQKFATTKTVIVRFEQILSATANDVGVPDLSRFGTVVSVADGAVSLAVPRDEVASITAKILNDFSVLDLTIEDPPIDDVIERVFAAGATVEGVSGG